MKHLWIIEVDIGGKIWRYRRGNQKNHQELQNSRYQPWKVSGQVFVLAVWILPLSTALIIDFGMDSTAWYVLFLFYNKN